MHLPTPQLTLIERCLRGIHSPVFHLDMHGPSMLPQPDKKKNPQKEAQMFTISSFQCEKTGTMGWARTASFIHFANLNIQEVGVAAL